MFLRLSHLKFFWVTKLVVVTVSVQHLLSRNLSCNVFTGWYKVRILTTATVATPWSCNLLPCDVIPDLGLLSLTYKVIGVHP